MNEAELTDKLREKYVGELGRKRKTVEEALQEALDNTTPEHPGAPNYDPFETSEEDRGSEWL